LKNIKQGPRQIEEQDNNADDEFAKNQRLMLNIVKGAQYLGDSQMN